MIMFAIDVRLDRLVDVSAQIGDEDRQVDREDDGEEKDRGPGKDVLPHPGKGAEETLSRYRHLCTSPRVRGERRVSLDGFGGCGNPPYLGLSEGGSCVVVWSCRSHGFR